MKQFNCNKAPENTTLKEILADQLVDKAGITTMEYANVPFGTGPKVPVNVLEMCLDLLKVGESTTFLVPVYEEGTHINLGPHKLTYTRKR